MLVNRMKALPAAIAIGKIVPGPPSFRNSTTVIAVAAPAANSKPDSRSHPEIRLVMKRQAKVNATARPEFKNHGS